jgi:hypothetical protein
VLNKRPDLFRAAIAGVPFVDALNTMLDAQLPLTITEYEEWGNPPTAPRSRRIRSYAPYENVRPQRYPAILATAGLNDPAGRVLGSREVGAATPRARDRGERARSSCTRTSTRGHAGASGRYQALEEQALRYASSSSNGVSTLAAEVRMDYRTLGSTGLKVSTVCLGGMTFGEADEKSFMHGIGSDEQTSFDVLDNAMEVGINFVDVADVYGQDGLERARARQVVRPHAGARPRRARDQVPVPDVGRPQRDGAPLATGSSARSRTA